MGTLRIATVKFLLFLFFKRQNIIKELKYRLEKLFYIKKQHSYCHCKIYFQR